MQLGGFQLGTGRGEAGWGSGLRRDAVAEVVCFCVARGGWGETDWVVSAAPA